eukprot:gene17196-20609_t
MPELSGLQFMKIVKGKCRVILTTAYSEYAFEGFENDAVDYLLKPVSFERFFKAAEKALFLLKGQSDQEKAEPRPASMQKEINHIFVKTEYKLVRINLADVLYVEAMQNYVVIYTGTEKITSLQTMKKTEEQLPPAQFLRIHKSFIIAINKINSIERNRIHIGSKIITLGEVYREAFYNAIENN